MPILSSHLMSSRMRRAPDLTTQRASKRFSAAEERTVGYFIRSNAHMSLPCACCRACRLCTERLFAIKNFDVRCVGRNNRNLDRAIPAKVNRFWLC